MKSAAKVGLLLVVFVALVFGSYSLLGKSLFSRRHHVYFVEMTDAGGLNQGTRVLMAGVEIGTVQKVDLLNAHKARLTLQLNSKYLLPVGSVARVPSSLVGFGDTSLTIEAPEDASGNLPENATISGVKSGPLDGLLPNGGKELYSNVNQTLTGVQKLVADNRLRDDLKKLLETATATLKSSQDALAKFSAIADRTNLLLANNSGNIQEMLIATKKTINEVQYTASTLADFVKQGKLQHGTVAMLDKAQAIEGEANKLLASLDKIASDPTLRSDLTATVGNTKSASDKLPALADNATKITANIAEITESAKPLPGTLNDVANKASKLEDRLSDLLDKVGSVKPPSAGGLKDFKAEIDLYRETNPGYWRTDINGSIPTHEGFVTFGVYDAFGGNKLNLQLGHTVSPRLDYRYGVYASKPGVGVDYQLSKKLSIRTDLWNINSPELDALFRYDFGGGLFGWAGFDEVLSRTVPTIGVGVRP